MQPHRSCFLPLIAALTLFGAPGHADSPGPADSPEFCNDTATAIPARTAGAATGSEIESSLKELDGDPREAALRREFLSGNMPAFLRHLQPVELDGTGSDGRAVRITLCVMPDYLAVGSDQDFFLAPMRLDSALLIANTLGFTLPTPAIVDAIYAASAHRLSPEPLPAGPRMRSTQYFVLHDALIRAQRDRLDVLPGMLVAGHKKDLVLTPRLWHNLERVAIYGWHRPNGSAIQPLSTVHGWHYVDYSHGVRLVSDRILVDGARRSLHGAFEDSRIARILDREGPISHLSELIEHLTVPHVTDRPVG